VPLPPPAEFCLCDATHRSQFNRDGVPAPRQPDPQDVPAILESRVAEADIQKEMDNAVRALDSTVVLAIAGD